MMLLHQSKKAGKHHAVMIDFGDAPGQKDRAHTSVIVIFAATIFRREQHQLLAFDYFLKGRLQEFHGSLAFGLITQL